MKQFSPKEQATLVWKFMCSVPVVLLEDLLPWTISFLSPHEQLEVINCIEKIVPEEKSLQEVINTLTQLLIYHNMNQLLDCVTGLNVL